MSTETPKDKKMPVHKISSPDGLITVAIWEYQTERGPRYNSTANRRYQDKDGKWHDSDAFFEDDMLPLSEMVREAWAWIRTRRRANAGARREAARQEQQPEDAA